MSEAIKRMADDIEEILFDEQTIEARVKELGRQLTEDYAGKEVVMIGILKGAVVFFADLMREMDVEMKIDFMGISSYGDAAKTSGIVRITKDMDTSITGKHLIIAEDIMDSGLTLSHLIRLLNERKPASIRTACLLDKTSRRECDITPDYCGFSIPDAFVVGYGLDYRGFYRNLPYIGVLKPEIYTE